MVENESRTLRCSMTRFGLQSVDVVVTRLTLLLASFHNDNMVNIQGRGRKFRPATFVHHFRTQLNTIRVTQTDRGIRSE